MSYNALHEIAKGERYREVERLRHYYGTNFSLPQAVLDELPLYAGSSNNDNFRFARCGEATMVEQYRQQYSKGCCGYVDKLVHDEVTGDFWMVGWNYGH